LIWDLIGHPLQHILRGQLLLAKENNSIETHFSDSNLLIYFREVKNCLIPEEFKLKNLLKKSALNQFMRTSKNSWGIHVFIVVSKNLDLLTGDYFQKIPQEFIANINEQERHYIDDFVLQKKKCLLPDFIIRDSHNFQQQPLPQVRHPRTGKMRKTIHDSVFVSTELKGAATK
jgi:hypothetical protein